MAGAGSHPLACHNDRPGFPGVPKGQFGTSQSSRRRRAPKEAGAIEILPLGAEEVNRRMSQDIKYEVDIEGHIYSWASSTITTGQIVGLAGWPAGTQVIEVDDDNNQRTLGPEETIELKPGHGFAKRHRFQRG